MAVIGEAKPRVRPVRDRFRPVQFTQRAIAVRYPAEVAGVL